ncbi:MAG: hypothetical protein LUD15_05290, partial [Bacteroides sp.]|nr:hypothetical protein [Bacteroides sp.]
FISEAARKVPAFNQIHTAQRKKEIDAWSHAISRAKYSGEISSDIPDQELGKMFIYLSDRISLTTISHKPNEETLRDLRNSWDNLYKLLQATEKK